MHVGILASHPIQYQAPWFRALSNHVDLSVYFAHRQSAQEQKETGFGVAFDWDVDLMAGYEHQFLRNVALRPSVNRYAGCDTPEIAAIIAGELVAGRKEIAEKENAQSLNSNVQSSAQHRFDAFIVMGWYLKSYMQAVRACRNVGIPVFARGDSQLRTPRPLLKRAAMEVRQRLLLRQFDGFLSPGKRHTEYLRHFGVPAEKIFFVPHFVDNERFATQANQIRNEKVEIRKQWGIAEDAFVPLFVGKFIPKKRPLDLVRAAQLLLSSSFDLPSSASVRKLHLLFVGSGELGAELRAHCHVVFDADVASIPNNREQITNNKKPSASFTGFLNQSEIAKAYVAADVLVAPSDSETWGLVVNEAMACGIPAIVSDAVGCAPDLIEEGKTGFSFELANSAALAARLENAAALKARRNWIPALRAKMAEYSIEVALAGTLKALRCVSDVASGGGNNSPRSVQPIEQIPKPEIVSLENIRLLVLLGGSHLFGQERANIEVIRSLCNLGAQARFITNSRHGHEQIEPELKRRGFSWSRAPFGFHWSRYMLGRHFIYFLRNLWGVTATSWRVFRETSIWKPTHFYTMNWNYFLLALPAIRWLQLPLVFRAGDTLPQHTRFHRWVMSQLRKHVSILVCNSQFVAKNFSALGFAPTVIYNYAPRREFHAQELDLTRIEGATVMVYLGQIAEHKGTKLLTETAITLIRAGRNVMLWIAGDSVWGDPLRGRLEEKVAAEAFTDRIRFFGWVQDVPALLCGADIHVCPSIWDEPSPNVIFEAKKAGLPTVAFPSGGIPELIEHGVDGLLCRDTSLSALADSLDRYILNPAERLSAGKAAQRSLQTKFAYGRFQREWASVF